MHRRGFTVIELLVVIAILAILVALTAPLLSGCGGGSNNYVIGKVKRVYEKSDKHYVAVELTDGSVETFENTDNPFAGKMGSSTLQNVLDSGKTYKFNVYGMRNEAMSMFRNIISVEEIR